MPSPRIGSGRSLQEAANKKAAAAMAETPQLTPEQIAALEEEKTADVARLRAVSAEMNRTPPQRPSLADLLTKASSGADTLKALDTAEREGQRAAEEEDQERARAMIAPHRERGHAAVTKMGILKRKHAERVSRVAALDLRAVLKRVPALVEPGKDYAPNHWRVEQYVRLARDIAEAFRTFKPVDWQDALRAAEGTVYRGSTSQDFLNEIRRHLPFHLSRLEGSVASVEERLGRLDKLEQQVTEDLAGVELVDAAPEPKPELLPPMLPTPARGRDTSYVDFDPRDPAPLTPAGPPVTRLGADGEGIRINGLERMVEKSDKAQIYGGQA